MGKQILELEPYMTKNTGIDTDWQDAMMRTGLSQNYMFSVRGGSEMPNIPFHTITLMTKVFSLAMITVRIMHA